MRVIGDGESFEGLALATVREQAATAVASTPALPQTQKIRVARQMQL
jgi:hypothetical protein